MEPVRHHELPDRVGRVRREINTDDAVLFIEGCFNFPIYVFTPRCTRTTQNYRARRAMNEILADSPHHVIRGFAIDSSIERIIPNGFVAVVESTAKRIVVRLVTRVVVTDEDSSSDE